MRRFAALPLLVIVLLCAVPASSSAAVPKRFFGIDPQTTLTDRDTTRMRRGGVDTIRVPVPWALVQPNAGGGFSWTALDQAVRAAARDRLEILPFLYASPDWVAGRQTALPVKTRRQRRAWTRFLRAIVHRYKPRGTFWRNQRPGLPRIPIRNWQMWNEANFFYFATPASPRKYARLLKISARAVRGVDRGANVIAAGLFANPKERPPRAMDAVAFLRRLYRVNGIKRFFDGVALHPYAANVRELARHTNAIRRVVRRAGDRRTGLYLTEIGWGSQARSPVSFEVGLRGQARMLRGAYHFLLRNRRRLNLKRVYWFTWRDVRPAPCNFCDSTGLFRAGRDLRPKPAWFAFTRITGGRAR